MQRQNRNTPVYNQELSGKTNYLVANLVPLGRNNAISKPGGYPLLRRDKKAPSRRKKGGRYDGYIF
mgnify:CR=1 FL=1